MARRMLLGIPAALLLAGVAAYDFGSGMANAAARQMSNEVATWATLLSGPRPDTVASVKAQLDRVAASAPDASYVQELQGIVSVRRRGDPSGIDAAKSLFSKAVQGRPVSPYTWANIAHVDYELGQTGEEFEAALRHAAFLGLWEPEVQNTIVNYGLAVRDEVSPQTQAVIDRVVSAAMRRNPLETLQIAERRGRLDVACRGVLDPGNDKSKQYLLCQ